MAKAKTKKQRDTGISVAQPGGAEKPLLVARMLSALILLTGAAMLIGGAGVISGKITEGWGFPMSAVPNWGRPWGAVLLVAAIAYIICPLLLLTRAKSGLVAMMILAGLNVLVGTPLITTTTEILYNVFRETKSIPDWEDSVWGFFMLINIATAIAVYRAHPSDGRPSEGRT